MRARWLASSLALCLCACAPGGEREPPDAGAPLCLACADSSVSMVGAIRSTLQTSCAYGGVELSCHAVASGGLTLGTGNDFAQIVGVPSTERPELIRVAPGRPAESYLWLKLVGDGGIEGGPMPGGASDPRLVALFGSWIEAGAPER